MPGWDSEQESRKGPSSMPTRQQQEGSCYPCPALSKSLLPGHCPGWLQELLLVLSAGEETRGFHFTETSCGARCSFCTETCTAGRIIRIPGHSPPEAAEHLQWLGLYRLPKRGKSEQTPWRPLAMCNWLFLNLLVQTPQL